MTAALQQVGMCLTGVHTLKGITNETGNRTFSRRFGQPLHADVEVKCNAHSYLASVSDGGEWAELHTLAT
jgi:hypothetical protein